MQKRTVSYLLLACLAGGVVFTIGLQASKRSLRVGTTVRHPLEYFEQQLMHQNLHFQTGAIVGQPGGWYTINTRFVVFDREITSKVCTYHFDTNGTVLSVSSRRYWPIFHF